MMMRYLLPVLLVIVVCIITAGCSQSPEQNNAGQVPATANSTPKVSAVGTTPADLTALVNRAAMYARENGKEKALAAFNDPNG